MKFGSNHGSGQDAGEGDLLLSNDQRLGKKDNLPDETFLGLGGHVACSLFMQILRRNLGPAYRKLDKPGAQVSGFLGWRSRGCWGRWVCAQ